MHSQGVTGRMEVARLALLPLSLILYPCQPPQPPRPFILPMLTFRMTSMCLVAYLGKTYFPMRFLLSEG